MKLMTRRPLFEEQLLDLLKESYRFLLVPTLIAVCTLSSSIALAQHRSARQMSLNVSATRTITSSIDLQKTDDCGTTKHSGGGTTTVTYHYDSKKVFGYDNGTTFQISAEGTMNSDSSQPLKGSGTITSNDDETTSYQTHCESDCNRTQKSSSNASAEADPEKISVSFNYDREKKQGDFSIHNEFSTANGSGTVSQTSCNENTSAQTGDMAKIGLLMASNAYGQFGVSNFDVMREAYGDNPELLAMTHKGLDASGNGGTCTIIENVRGFEISYSNTATIDNTEGQNDGYTGKSTTTITTTVHISVGGEAVHYDAILVPGSTIGNSDDYKKWIPVGSPVGKPDEPGNRIAFHIKLVNKDKNNEEVKDVPFTVTYTLESSKEPGIAINYPVSSSDVKPDLRFDKSLSKYSTVAEVSDTKLASTDKRGRDVDAVIACYDYGAYGTLRAKVVVPPATELDAHLEKGGDRVNIPMDDNNNHVADAWEKDSAVFGYNRAATWDEEVQSGNSHNGDGLTFYEEYRGVISKGKHRRLSPNHKEVFVVNSGKVPLDGGYGLFQKASGIAAIDLKSGDEANATTPIVNTNSKTGRGGEQHGIPVQFVKLDDIAGSAVLGKLVAKASPPPPGLDPNSMEARTAMTQEPVAHSPKDVDYLAINEAATPGSELNWTFAHEISHGLNVRHHGDKKPFILESATSSLITRPALVFVTEDGKTADKQMLLSQIRSTPVEAALPGSQSSGDVDCIMCYNSVYELSFPNGSAGNLLVFSKLDPRTGTKFCTSKAGTGRNAPDFKMGTVKSTVFGDAIVGDCMSQFTVKDW